MNTAKRIIKNLILVLTLVGPILLILPASLHAHHFRYGTMSWEPITDNGTHVTILLNMQNGWTANHGSFRSAADYNTFVPGYVGSIKNNLITINWDDTNTTAVDGKILSRDNTTTSESASDCASNCIDSTI